MRLSGEVSPISIHAPHARSDPSGSSVLRSTTCNFNPRSSCEERHKGIAAGLGNIQFQSTFLMRGATREPISGRAMPIFQSTLLMRGATVPFGRATRRDIISIHAPHARSDCTIGSK